MRKHLKLIIVLVIIAIAGGAVFIHKKIEKKGDQTFTVNVTVQDKISGETYLNKFAFTTKEKNIESFLEKNTSIFSAQFNDNGNSDDISSLFGIANSSQGSWKYSYSPEGSNTNLVPADNLNSISLKNKTDLTFVYEK